MSTLSIRCAFCSTVSEKHSGAVNRAIRLGSPMFCNSKCYGLSYRQKRSPMTREVLKKILRYNAKTGDFFWRIKTNHVSPGTKAGTISTRYVQIRRFKITYMAHRLAWLYMTGEWPTYYIDHINGVCHDNRWANLRDVTQSVNLQNQRAAGSANKSGALGVAVDVERGTFRAVITINRKQIWLGRFDTVVDASRAYIEAKRKLHEGCTI